MFRYSVFRFPLVEYSAAINQSQYANVQEYFFFLILNFETWETVYQNTSYCCVLTCWQLVVLISKNANSCFKNECREKLSWSMFVYLLLTLIRILFLNKYAVYIFSCTPSWCTCCVGNNSSTWHYMLCFVSVF